MSTFKKSTSHPITGDYEEAIWHDDYFGRHKYGVEFSDGKIYDPRAFENTLDSKMETREYLAVFYKRGAKMFQLWYGNNYVSAKSEKEALEEMAKMVDVPF